MAAKQPKQPKQSEEPKKSVKKTEGTEKSYEERTRVQQPWLNKDGTQNIG